jgi:hypothetical protein
VDGGHTYRIAVDVLERCAPRCVSGGAVVFLPSYRCSACLTSTREDGDGFVFVESFVRRVDVDERGKDLWANDIGNTPAYINHMILTRRQRATNLQITWSDCLVFGTCECGLGRLLRSHCGLWFHS